MFGSQSLSRRRSAPIYGFGTSVRDQYQKVFMSQEHEKLKGGNINSPGPAVYSLHSALGKQLDGRKGSAPTWMFGTTERFAANRRMPTPGPGTYTSRSAFGTQATSRQESQPIYGFGTSNRVHVAKCFISEEHNRTRYGLSSPGPSVYKLKDGVGKQDDSKKASAPAWVFGSTKRFQYDHVKRAATSPGPGAYSSNDAVGLQVSSTMASAPMAGFGTSERHHMAKVYISPEHEKVSAGNHSPGPSVYTLNESTGKQSLSKNTTLPSWGFGTADRWQGGHRNESPGPGSYCV